MRFASLVVAAAFTLAACSSGEDSLAAQKAVLAAQQAEEQQARGALARAESEKMCKRFQGGTPEGKPGTREHRRVVNRVTGDAQITSDDFRALIDIVCPGAYEQAEQRYQQKLASRPTPPAKPKPRATSKRGKAPWATNNADTADCERRYAAAMSDIFTREEQKSLVMGVDVDCAPRSVPN